LPSDIVTFAQPLFEPSSWAVQSGASPLLEQSLPSLWLLGVVLVFYILFVGAFPESANALFGVPNVLQVQTFRLSDRAQVGPVAMRPGTQVVFYAAPPVRLAPVRVESNELAPGETWTVQWGVDVFWPRSTPFFTWPVEYFADASETDETYRLAREQFLSGAFNFRFMSDMPPPVFESAADPVQTALQAPLGSDVIFGAWLDTPLYDFGVSDDAGLKTRAMHLLVARFSISTSEASIIFPGDIPVWPEEPFDSLMRCRGWWGPGASTEQVTFSAWLPQSQPTDLLLVGKVAFDSSDSSQRLFDVWNVRRQAWDTFAYEGTPVELPVADYAEASGRVRIRLPEDTVCTYPAIGLRRTGGAGS